MKKPVIRKLRCAVYTRKSSEEGLEQEFNSLDAQREACEAYIASQKAEGWVLVPDRYDDGGISGATLERPALKLVDPHEQNHQGPQKAGGDVPVGRATGGQPACRPADDEPRRSLSGPGGYIEEEEEQKEEIKCPIP